jgi:hypothetical protein
MKAIRNLMLFALAGSFLFLLFGWYSGFFARAKVEVKSIDSFVAVYHNHQGEYSKTLTIQDQIADMLWEDGVDNYQNFGIYFDDPKTTDSDDLHSIAGRVIAAQHESRVVKNSDKYQIYLFKRKNAAVVELPVKNIFSLYAGIYKAYPLLEAYAAEHRIEDIQVIEVYDIPGKIRFILPLGDD